MITDQLTNIIYFSLMLEQVCPDLYRSISTLKAKGYPLEFFQGVNADKRNNHHSFLSRYFYYLCAIRVITMKHNNEEL